MHTKTDRIQAQSILIAILPILSIYKLGNTPLTFGDLAVVFIVVLSYIRKRGEKINITIPGFILYFYICFIISLISIFFRGQRDVADFFTKWLKLVVYYYVIENACDIVDSYQVILMQKCNVVAGLIVSFILFYQVIMAYFFKNPVTFFISFLPLNYGVSASNLQILWNRRYALDVWRPFSIFCEPAHFAQFVLMSLVIALFCNEMVMSKKQKMILSILFTIAILLSYSANGIFIASILWFVWFIKYMKGKKITIKKILITIMMIGVWIYAFVTMGFMESAFNRLDTVSLGRGSTGTLRLLQGLAVYAKLPSLAKLFGIGFGNVEAFLIENNITTVYLSDIGNEYMNGFSTVLVSSGIIGLIIYLAIWMHMFFKYKNMVSRGAFLVVTALFCTSAMFYSLNTVMYLVFICCSGRELSFISVENMRDDIML